MKLILCAVALAFAAPAAAQTAPVDHSKMDHSQHGQMDHSKHAPAQGQHKGHGEGKTDDCPGSKGGKMDCCEHAEGKCPKAADGKEMACCDHEAHKTAGATAHGDHGGH
ncbi:MAG TPA: hypothetical protein VIA98_07725 [Allosphingosinicella sp.]|jgi:hypothetical protein